MKFSSKILEFSQISKFEKIKIYKQAIFKIYPTNIIFQHPYHFDRFHPVGSKRNESKIHKGFYFYTRNTRKYTVGRLAVKALPVTDSPSEQLCGGGVCGAVCYSAEVNVVCVCVLVCWYTEVCVVCVYVRVCCNRRR